MTAEGLAPDPGKLEAVIKQPMPFGHISQLRSVLGTVETVQNSSQKGGRG